MKFINKTRFLSFLPQIIASLFLAGFVAYAWTGPAGPPPTANVDAPINVGTTSQYKAGAFGLGGLFHGYSDAIFDGKVSVGTAIIKGDGSISTNLNADKIDGYHETDILILGKKVCQQFTSGPKVCYPLVNKIANTYYYIDGTAVKSIQGGTFYDSCAPNSTTYRHQNGRSYFSGANCTGDEYTNGYQGWHNFCINDINDPNLNSGDCNLPGCLNNPDDGNCWYGRDPFYGNTTGVPACVTAGSPGLTIQSFKSGAGCTNWSGFLSPNYKFVNTPAGYTCCTIEQ